MSLPASPKQSWPPESPSSGDLAVWGAWYSGSPTLLSKASVPRTTGGVVERATRGYWHRHACDVGGPAKTSVQPLHMPLAEEIAAVSADLLFGDFPDVRIPEGETGRDDAKNAQARLEELVSAASVQNGCLEAAEGASALGGVYVRVCWDTDVADHPFITAHHADQAVPEFRYGRLQAVTLWRELARDGSLVYRHLERHEPGVVLHGLYMGDATTLGNRVALAVHPETETLPEEVPLPEGVRMAAFYVPNVKPNRRNRSSPEGRADIAGSEGALDAFDETWSSLMRDIRIGQARILVPTGSLEPPKRGKGRGRGKALDLDREVFTELEGLDPAEQEIKPVEFKLRTTEHLETAVALLERIVSAAGYSPQTFGLHIEGRAESGTALKIREGRTFKTIARKQRYWSPVLADVLEARLAVDRAVFGRPVTPARPMVTWQEVQETPAELAATVEALRRAEAVSVATAVRLAQPELSEEEAAEEAERILKETGRIVPDPFQTGDVA
jgi:A118 family predicted phage portal protein